MTPTRRQRRWVSVAAVVMGIVAIKLLSVGFFAGRGNDAYAADRYGAARSSYGALNVANVVETWIAPYNRGVAQYQLGNYSNAVSDFRTALNRAPDRCDVRVNLVLAMEADIEAQREDVSEATTRGRYLEALDIAGNGDCGDIDPETPPSTPDSTPASSEPTPASTEPTSGSSPSSSEPPSSSDPTATTTPSSGTQPSESSSPETTTGSSGQDDPEATETTQGDEGEDGDEGEADEPSAQERLDQARQRIQEQLGNEPADPDQPPTSNPQDTTPPTSPDAPDQNQTERLQERIRQAGAERRSRTARDQDRPDDRNYDDPAW